MAYYKAMADNTVDDVVRWQDHVESRQYGWITVEFQIFRLKCMTKGKDSEM